MNVDFSLPRTGAIARRLLHIAELCKIELDPKVAAIAKEDLLPIDDDPILPLIGVRRAATQFMFDCDFRCILTANHIDRHLILNAIGLAKIQPITIASYSSTVDWKNALNIFKNTNHVKLISVKDAILPENQQGREGVLILEWSTFLANDGMLISIIREFPKVVIYCDLGSHNRVSNYRSLLEIGTCLFPQMPKIIYDHRELTKSSVWKKTDLFEMAIFYNIFMPHFITIPGYQEPFTDDIVKE